MLLCLYDLVRVCVTVLSWDNIVLKPTVCSLPLHEDLALHLLGIRKAAPCTACDVQSWCQTTVWQCGTRGYTKSVPAACTPCLNALSTHRARLSRMLCLCEPGWACAASQGQSSRVKYVDSSWARGARGGCCTMKANCPAAASSEAARSSRCWKNVCQAALAPSVALPMLAPCTRPEGRVRHRGPAAAEEASC